MFPSLTIYNNKSSFRRRRICSVKQQALKLTMITIFHNKTKIKYNKY